MDVTLLWFQIPMNDCCLAFYAKNSKRKSYTIDNIVMFLHTNVMFADMYTYSFTENIR